MLLLYYNYSFGACSISNITVPKQQLKPKACTVLMERYNAHAMQPLIGSHSHHSPTKTYVHIVLQLSNTCTLNLHYTNSHTHTHKLTHSYTQTHTLIHTDSTPELWSPSFPYFVLARISSKKYSVTGKTTFCMVYMGALSGRKRSGGVRRKSSAT